MMPPSASLASTLIERSVNQVLAISVLLAVAWADSPVELQPSGLAGAGPVIETSWRRYRLIIGIWRGESTRRSLRFPAQSCWAGSCRAESRRPGIGLMRLAG